MSTQYDFMGEALLADFFNNNSLFAIGKADPADYSYLFTDSLDLTDNDKPEASVFEWPTGGVVTCHGKMKQASHHDQPAPPENETRDKLKKMKPKWEALFPTP